MQPEPDSCFQSSVGQCHGTWNSAEGSCPPPPPPCLKPSSPSSPISGSQCSGFLNECHQWSGAGSQLLGHQLTLPRVTWEAHQCHSGRNGGVSICWVQRFWELCWSGHFALHGLGSQLHTLCSVEKFYKPKLQKLKLKCIGSGNAMFFSEWICDD